MQWITAAAAAAVCCCCKLVDVFESRAAVELFPGQDILGCALPARCDEVGSVSSLILTRGKGEEEEAKQPNAAA